MTDSLRDALHEAAADDTTQTFGTSGQDLLARGRTRRRRRTAGAGGSVLAVGAVVAVMVAGTSVMGGDEPPDVVDQPTPKPPSGRGTPMEREPLSSAQAQEVLNECIVEGDPSGLRVAYAWRMAIPQWVDWGLPYDSAVVALDDAGRRVWTCASNGTSDNGWPSGDKPLELLGGGAGTQCTSSRFRWHAGDLMAVSDEVDRVEIRFGSDRRPGQRWVSRPHNGYLAVARWLDIPRHTDETYRVETWAYDVDGNLIESDVLADFVDEELTPREIQRCAIPRANG
jgi:hypothetical protein